MAWPQAPGLESGNTPRWASGRSCPSLRKRCHFKLERGALSGNHTPCSEGVGHTRAWTTAATPAPAGLGAWRAWGPGLSLGLMVAGGQPAEVGVVDGMEVAFSRSSPSIPHSPGFCQVCTRGLSSLPSEASLELPERLPWGGGGRSCILTAGGPPAFLSDTQRSGCPTRLPHSWLCLCAQPPPQVPLHPEQTPLLTDVA